MELYGYEFIREADLAHHGIKGQKWGVRRFQNADGSLTAAGEKRYYGRANALQRDIDSFKGLENGIYANSGKMLLSPSDVQRSVQNLKMQQRKAKEKGDQKREKEFRKYQMEYGKAYRKNYIKAHNMAAQYLNGPDGFIKLNNEWQKSMSDYDGDWSKSPRYGEYVNAAQKLMSDTFEESMKSLIGERPHR